MQSDFKGFIKTNKWIVFIVILLLIAVVFTIIQSVRATRYERQLKAMYTKSYYELIGSMDNIEVSISKMMVSSKDSTDIDFLSNIVRLSNTASSSLSSIPVSHPAFASTMGFLNKLSDYCGAVRRHISEGMPLTDDEKKSLIELHNASSVIYAQLAEIGDEGIDFSMKDSEFWLNSQPEESLSNTFMNRENSGIAYPSLIYDGPFSDGHSRMEPRGLSQGIVSVEKSIEKYEEIFDDNFRDDSEVAGDIPGHLLLSNEKSMLISNQGGQLVWMLSKIGNVNATLSSSECISSARETLNELGYKNLAVTWEQQYDGHLVINFAGFENDVVYYSDLIKVKVRMDTGEIIGIDAFGYLMNHTLRDVPNDLISMEEAVLNVSENLQIQSNRICVIPTPNGNERICWEFRGKFGGDIFMVYIDAYTGAEIKILRVIDTEDGALVV